MLNSLGKKPTKILSKETLNHRELITMVSGINPLQNTSVGYSRVFELLGVNSITRVPIASRLNLFEIVTQGYNQ